MDGKMRKITLVEESGTLSLSKYALRADYKPIDIEIQCDEYSKKVMIKVNGI